MKKKRLVFCEYGIMTLLPKQLQPSSIHERGRSAKGDNIPSNIKVTQEKNGLSVA